MIFEDEKNYFGPRRAHLPIQGCLAFFVLAVGTILPLPLGPPSFSFPLQARAWVNRPGELRLPRCPGRES